MKNYKKYLFFVASGILIGSTGGFVCSRHFSNKNKKWDMKRTDKFKGYYNMLNQWLCLKQKGESLENFFIDRGYKTVAIYGMGEMGCRFYDELKNSDKVCIKFGIDKNIPLMEDGLKTYGLEDIPDSVDVVVVTATFAFNEIKENLEKKLSSKIISLDDVVFDI